MKLRDLDILLEQHLFKNELEYDANGEPYYKGAVMGDTVIAWVYPYSKDLASAWYAAKKLQEIASPFQFRKFISKLNELTDGQLIRYSASDAARLICIAVLFALVVDIKPEQTFDS